MTELIMSFFDDALAAVEEAEFRAVDEQRHMAIVDADGMLAVLPRRIAVDKELRILETVKHLRMVRSSLMPMRGRSPGIGDLEPL